ncbi:MAG: hypothetical protein M0P74_16070 [Syntrophales bacterium]|jgi:hypothetical protein|nr:hypothetical protein [Syntrophales bacterium]
MNQQKSDQKWQQLQSHIEGFFGQALRNGIQRIEYRPQYTALLAMPFERDPTISDNFSQKEDKYE